MNEIAGILYRKDLFEDPKEQAAFRAKYGYPLAPPKTFASTGTWPSSSTGRPRCTASP